MLNARYIEPSPVHDNSDLSRMDTVDEKIMERNRKYKAAIALLEA